MIGYILEGFVNFAEGLAMALFIGFVVLPVLFVGFFTSAVYAVQAVSYYLMIKNETYLKRGWSFTRADIIEENGTLKLCWFTDKRSYTRNFHEFTYYDTVPILYKIKKPKNFIRCDESYWLSKMRTRCILTVLWGIVFIPLLIGIFF